MNLTSIYAPAQPLLERAEAELGRLIQEFRDPEVHEVLGQFLSHPGKRIRPALLFLSAGAGNPGLREVSPYLVKAATAFELVHSASLVHDDIIDVADLRRGAATVNGRFGNTVAVLAGDLLYAQAFLMLPDNIPIFRIILNVTKRMCMGEIHQLRAKTMTEELYFKVIESKTALLMSASCEVGALLSNSRPEVVAALREFGLRFGFLYQLVDDWLDQDAPVENFHFAGQIERHRRLAQNCLNNLPESAYRTSLSTFVDELAAEAK
ncbi:MAG: polyprenyl synthetase family protein [Veillonellaceae bacterium]|jgi:geranylgeranyl pyrophosphate synthase|nr:polyprenyl synthetase family protein [Veillonellaceae bacterium]